MANLFDPIDRFGEEVLNPKPTDRPHVAPRRAEANPDSLISQYNSAVTIEQVLLDAGYEQRGATFRHPASKSGSFSASVQNGRVHSFSSNDPLYTGGDGGGAHDAFSAMRVLCCKSDMALALSTATSHLALNDFNEIAGRDKPQKRAFGFREIGEMLANHSPPSYLIHGLLEKGCVATLFGASGCGKSFLAIAWSASIATGAQWFGRSVKQGPVFYIAGEGHGGITRRTRAWEIDTGLRLQGAPLFISDTSANFSDANNTTAVLETIKAMAAQSGEPALIVIDTLHRNMNGDENSSRDFAVIMQNIDAVRHELPSVTILLVHHTGHGDGNRARGSSSIRAAMDVELCLTKADDGAIALAPTKVKEGECFQPLGMRLEQITLDLTQEDGLTPLTSAVLQPAKIGNRQSEKLSGMSLTALKAIEEAIAGQGKMPPNTLQLFCETLPLVVVLEDDWRKQFYALISDRSPDAQRKAFGRAKQALIALGKIEAHGESPRVWWRL